MEVRQGEVYYVDFPTAEDLPENWGSTPKEPHLVVVVQGDHANASNLNTVVCCLLTSNLDLAGTGGNVLLEEDEANTDKRSVVNVSQMIALDKSMLGHRFGRVNEISMHRIKKGIRQLIEGFRVFPD